MKNTVINIKDVTKHYGNFKALDTVNMHVDKGDIYGLVGKNGAGKTTLFKTILGLSDLSDGEISILGSKNNQELLKARNKIGFLIGQNFYGDMDAKSNINYYRKLKGIKDPHETERVLKIVGLDKETKPFKSYSMGMKQRLGIANAILGNPEIVILDEPINGLDPQGIKEVRALIQLLNKEFDMTLIISSHILSELDLVAHRFGIIDEGILIKEIDKHAFEKEMEETIILYTLNIKETQNYLNQSMPKAKITQNGNEFKIQHGEKKVSELILDLVNENILIDGIHRQNESLEDIYFELTEKGE